MATSAAERRDLKTILKEMTDIQEEYRGKNMPQNVGDRFKALGAEAKAVQDETDREKQIKQFEQYLREVPDPALPAGAKARGNTGDFDTSEPAHEPSDVIGRLSLGDAFVNSTEYKTFRDLRMPMTGSAPFVAEGASLRDPNLPVTRAMLVQKGMERFVQRVQQRAREAKAVPTIGAGVVRADRQPEAIRSAEMNRRTVRDLVQVLNTSSDSIDWVTVTAFTNIAAMVAPSAQKPEATGTLGSGTAPVRTVAAWMPVTTQQLEDIPQLQGIIDSELRFMLEWVEEQQMLWGDGTGQNLLGIFATPGVAAGRTEAGDTILDQIRRAMTDIRIANLIPNGLVIDPRDWEDVVLAKGTDGHYLNQAFPAADGNLRVWGLTVVETNALENPSGTPTTRERRFLVGDFQRGATLWDRRAINVQVGLINDQLIRNQRTILAEERVAFAARRPLAFKYRITQAAVA